MSSSTSWSWNVSVSDHRWSVQYCMLMLYSDRFEQVLNYGATNIYQQRFLQSFAAHSRWRRRTSPLRADLLRMQGYHDMWGNRISVYNLGVVLEPMQDFLRATSADIDACLYLRSERPWRRSKRGEYHTAQVEVLNWRPATSAGSDVWFLDVFRFKSRTEVFQTTISRSKCVRPLSEDILQVTDIFGDGSMIEANQQVQPVALQRILRQEPKPWKLLRIKRNHRSWSCMM